MKAVADPPGSDTLVDAGNMLMRGTWNAAPYHPLLKTFDDKLPRPDVVVHKVSPGDLPWNWQALH